jgi:multimeric flavodoxin WrbA
MSKKILILKSSPRFKGNSSVLADQAAAGAVEMGAQVESVDLQRWNIQPCDACDACRDSGICAIGDDMQMLYPKILDADAILLASPIYWFTYSAQLKICIDRWYALYNHNGQVFKDKPFGVILTYGDADLQSSGAINAVHTFDSMFRFTGAVFAGFVHGSLSDVGDAQKHPELMQQAYELGKLLA